MTSPANETASNSPPAVLSAAQRHDLARQFERAKQLAAKSPPDYIGVHRVLSECCTLDPGNTLFVAALLENLERAKGKTQTKWFWQVWQLSHSLTVAMSEKHWTNALTNGWAMIGERPRDSSNYLRLARICEALDHRQTELLLLKRAKLMWPGNCQIRNRYLQAEAEAGHFHTTQSLRSEKPAPPDGKARTTPEAIAEVIPRIERLIAKEKWDLAEKVLMEEGGALGANLRLRELGEELTLGRARERTKLATEQAHRNASARAQELVGEMLAEQRRIELGVAFARYERFSSDPAASWELAGCLTRAGNYSEALKYLSPLTNDEKWRLQALIAAGENWQHLRQFERALGAYREALSTDSAAGNLDLQNEHVQRGWYRAAVLAEATGDPRAALAWLEQLAAVNPGYKDASARLVNLRAICNKGGFPAEPQSDSSRGT